MNPVVVVKKLMEEILMVIGGLNAPMLSATNVTLMVILTVGARKPYVKNVRNPDTMNIPMVFSRGFVT